MKINMYPTTFTTIPQNIAITHDPINLCKMAGFEIHGLHESQQGQRYTGVDAIWLFRQLCLGVSPLTINIRIIRLDVIEFSKLSWLLMEIISRFRSASYETWAQKLGGDSECWDGSAVGSPQVGSHVVSQRDGKLFVRRRFCCLFGQPNRQST